MPGVCPRCNRKVYTAEQKIALGRVWHTFCYSCYKCRKLLGTTSEVHTNNNELLCVSCHDSLCNSSTYQTLTRSRNAVTSHNNVSADNNLLRLEERDSQNQKSVKVKATNQHSYQGGLHKLNFSYQESASLKKSDLVHRDCDTSKEPRNQHCSVVKSEEPNLIYRELAYQKGSNQLYQGSDIPHECGIYNATQESETLDLPCDEHASFNSSNSPIQESDSRNQYSHHLNSEEAKLVNLGYASSTRSDSPCQDLDGPKRNSKSQQLSHLKSDLTYEDHASLKTPDYPSHESEWHQRKSFSQHSSPPKSEGPNVLFRDYEPLKKSNCPSKTSDTIKREARSQNSSQLKSDNPNFLYREYESSKGFDSSHRESDCPKRGFENHSSQPRSVEPTLQSEKALNPETNDSSDQEYKCPENSNTGFQEHNTSDREDQQRSHEIDSSCQSQSEISTSSTANNSISPVENSEHSCIQDTLNTPTTSVIPFGGRSLEGNCTCRSSALPALHTIPSPTAITAWYSRQHSPKRVHPSCCGNAVVEFNKTDEPCRVHCSSDQSQLLLPRHGTPALTGKSRSLSDRDCQLEKYQHNYKATRTENNISVPHLDDYSNRRILLNYDYCHGRGMDSMTSSAYSSGNDFRNPRTKLGGGYNCRRCGRQEGVPC